MNEPADTPSSDSPRELPAPSVDELLDDIPGGEPNLLPEAATHGDLKVWFELWTWSDPTLAEESVKLFFDADPDPVDFRTWNAPIEESDRYVTLPQRLLRGNDGRHRLRYIATAYNNESDESAELVMTLDTTPPVLAASSKLIFPSEVLPPNKLTAHYLEQNGDEVKANLPPYTDPRPWDRITWYWGATPGTLDPGGVIELDDRNFADPIVVTIPAALVQSRGDGWRYVWYQVEDRAGNQSLRSEPVELDVAATPIPRDLPWPSVEGALGTGEQQTLDPWVPTDGVAIVQVPETAVIYPGEKVWVQWGEPGTLGATRVEQPISSGSRRYRVEMQYLAAHIGRVLPVSYGVVEASGQEHPSIPRRLQVRTIPSNRLEAVQCDGLSGGHLSYNAVAPQGARLTLKKWPLITTDHWIMITMTGVNSSGQDSVFEAVRRRAVTEQETIAGIGFSTDVRVLKTFLNTLRRNAPLTGKAYVSFDGGKTWPPLAAPNFPLLQLTLVD
ncbi:hypothetical protein [Pseudomonas citrulli]|uniref:Uncharacterized protein n=1 Tax=Pseudomonas citrulli TaxID=3064347 RepID=A0ABT9BZ63_9PSED|nr:hypothetical protein [Pseudomonas sp. K18]MDO7897847.1 hypothetical protein [Pseudomonas sp. K18]